jgi:hypothetical protein
MEDAEGGGGGFAVRDTTFDIFTTREIRIFN